MNKKTNRAKALEWWRGLTYFEKKGIWLASSSELPFIAFKKSSILIEREWKENNKNKN